MNEDVFLSPITPGLEKIKTHEGDGIVKMNIDKAIASREFSIHGTEFLKILKKELYGKDKK